MALGGELTCGAWIRGNQWIIVIQHPEQLVGTQRFETLLGREGDCEQDRLEHGRKPVVGDKEVARRGEHRVREPAPLARLLVPDLCRTGLAVVRRGGQPDLTDDLADQPASHHRLAFAVAHRQRRRQRPGAPPLPEHLPALFVCPGPFRGSRGQH